MTPIESLYEIEAAILHLHKYLSSKDRVVSKRARIQYEQLIDRFFKEHSRYVAPEQRINCLDDVDYFLGLMDSVKEYYEVT